MSARREFTKRELLGAARNAGYSPSSRLVSDWVSLGLLDQANRRGLGRGQGTRATWAEQQLNLFLTLLEKRPTVAHVAPLCNIPVFVWLWFGDDFVPLRQTRRALLTWAGANQSASWRAARASAERLTSQFAHPSATEQARERFMTVIAETIYGKPFDAEVILAALRGVFDPNAEGRMIGPPGLVFRPEHFVDLIRTRLNALAKLRADAVPDSAFVWAGAEYVESRHDYERLLPAVAQDAAAVEFFFEKSAGGVVVPDTTLDHIANSACVDLLTMIGLYLENRRRAAENAHPENPWPS